MSDTLADRSAPAWARLVPALGLRWGRTTLVLGEDAAEVARAHPVAGVPALVGADERRALLSEEVSEADLDGLEPGATGLPAGSVDLVVLRYVASGRSGVTEALREAYRILRPGGGVAISDVNLETLMDSSTFRYPSRLQYDLFPEVLRREEARHVDGPDLDIEVIRAGFRSVDGHEIDHEYGEFPTHDAYLRAVKTNGWRSFDLMEDEQVERVLEELERLLPQLAPVGIVGEREPWHVTRGLKPDQSW